MNLRYIKAMYFIAILLIFNGCKDDENFDNKLFISTEKLSTIIIKSSTSDEEKVVQVAMARPQDQPVHAQLQVDPNLVAKFNQRYSTKAELLTDQNYLLIDKEVVISSGSVVSSPLRISFKNVKSLDKEKIYVLPLKLVSSTLAVIESQAQIYYVFKGGALINSVANLEQNYLFVDAWKDPSVLNNLSKFTMEALIRAKDFKNMISTVMGVEGSFLIRLGDAGFPSNQVQVATADGNIPGKDPNKGLIANSWTHIAVTYDLELGIVKIYINGKLQSQGEIFSSEVDFGIDGIDGFQIGRSYADDRFLAGEFSECRIWNIVRSEEDIASSIYDVATDSEGLVAYWKCNEGAGNLVKDHTANENHLIAKNPIKWINVSLPAN